MLTKQPGTILHTQVQNIMPGMSGLFEPPSSRFKFDRLLIWDRCYDFLNISAKIWAFFAQTTASFCKHCANNIGFWEKRHFFRRKLKIVIITSTPAQKLMSSEPASGTFAFPFILSLIASWDAAAPQFHFFNIKKLFVTRTQYLRFLKFDTVCMLHTMPGTNVMILKIISSKKWRFWL
jgi:hypothetical protein